MPQPKKQKRPARITSFPFFPRLPLELQDEIWKFALGNDVPAAHIVNIDHEYSPDQSPARLLLQRLDATGYSSRFMKPVSPPRQALVQTCRRSRLIVEKIIKTWECYYHPDAQQMNYPCFYEYDKFHSKTYMVTAPPRPKIYTSRDLFVFSNPWIGGELIYNGLPSQSISVKYAAIPYSHDASGCWHYVSTGGIRSFIDVIFPVFDNLQTLYILIHPDKLRKGEQFEVLSLVPAMKEHLKNIQKNSERHFPSEIPVRRSGLSRNLGRATDEAEPTSRPVPGSHRLGKGRKGSKSEKWWRQTTSGHPVHDLVAS